MDQSMLLINWVYEAKFIQKKVLFKFIDLNFFIWFIKLFIKYMYFGESSDDMYKNGDI